LRLFFTLIRFQVDNIDLKSVIRGSIILFYWAVMYYFAVHIDRPISLMGHIIIVILAIGTGILIRLR
jgi:hypothetical protein